MPIGIALIKTLSMMEKAVYSKIKGGKGIIECYQLFGEYNLFVRYEAPNIDLYYKSLARIKGVDEEHSKLVGGVIGS